MAEIANISFPGIVNPISATFALSHGISPSVCSIEFAPQATPIARIGTLAISYSDGVNLTTISFSDCIIDRASVQRNSGGYIVAASILDRRWKWQFGTVFGEYNLRDAEKNLISGTWKTTRQLAELLLEEMGETVADLTAVPNDFSLLHEVKWNGNNPAAELATLLDKVGCRIILDENDQTKIVALGTGAAAPTGGILSRSGDLDPPEAPDNLFINFGPTKIEARLELEAVGRDTDGEWKLIDNLSYKPTDGWSNQSSYFSGVTGKDARKACLDTVFKCYRVKLPDEGLEVAITDMDPFTITGRYQILPLLTDLVQTWTDPEDNKKKPRPPKVYGTYWIRNIGEPKNSSATDDNYELETPFQIMPEEGIFVFQEIVKKFVDDPAPAGPADYSWEPAELFADVAFHVKGIGSRALHRYGYTHPTGNSTGTKDEFVDISEDHRLGIYQERTEPEDEAFTWKTQPATLTELDTTAQAEAAEAMKKYSLTAGEVISYGRIVKPSIDGINQQVVWTIGRSGHTTQLSRNCEGFFLVPDYSTRRDREKSKRRPPSRDGNEAPINSARTIR